VEPRGRVRGDGELYRAIVRDRPTPATETVEVPTLVIWGAKDRFLSTRLAGGERRPLR